MGKLLLSYQSFIKLRLSVNLDSDNRDLHFWQSQLSVNFLIYCLPISLIALLPGVYMAIKDGLPIIAAVDLVSFGLIFIVTFCKGISLRVRKVCVVVVFYVLSAFLINVLGYMGPGVFYLFFLSVLIALVFSIPYAYWSILFNAGLLSVFAVIIHFRLFNSALVLEYTTGKWLAFSANLIFASLVIVLLIDKIFEGLQLTIIKKGYLRDYYKSIFNKSPLPMWLFDTETMLFLDVNEAAVRHYGYNRDEFLKMTIKDIRKAERLIGIEELVKANKLSGKHYEGNAQHIKKNGDEIYVKIESDLIHLDGREARLVLATDITTQVEHQLQLFDVHMRVKESESNLKAIFESSMDGFVLLDTKGSIKTFNSKASESMKFNKDQSVFEIGKSIYDYVQTTRLVTFKQAMRKVYAGETIDYDRRYSNEDGSLNWIRYTLTPVLEEGHIIGACITGRDVTARKLYLKSVEDQNKTFKEISWMQSHLVRAPLARLMGLLPLLEASTNEDRATIIEYIDESARELDDIILQISNKSHQIVQKYPEATHVDH